MVTAESGPRAGGEFPRPPAVGLIAGLPAEAENKGEPRVSRFRGRGMEPLVLLIARVSPTWAYAPFRLDATKSRPRPRVNRRFFPRAALISKIIVLFSRQLSSAVLCSTPSTDNNNDTSMTTTNTTSDFEVSIYTNDGDVFASVRHLKTGNGADFYSAGEEIGWQDNNSLFCNCDDETIHSARKVAAFALR